MIVHVISIVIELDENDPEYSEKLDRLIAFRSKLTTIVRHPQYSPLSPRIL